MTLYCANAFLTFKNQFVGKSGIEIGGPSQVFSRRGAFPVYSVVEKLDNCNFSGSTVWEESVIQGSTYRFDPGKPAGQQYIVEATDMGKLPSGAYDFVLYRPGLIGHCFATQAAFRMA
jgi:hypothetical protein